jgi:DNA-binding GntR family transcriptional regulator
MNQPVDLSAQAETAIRDSIIRGKFSFGEKLSDRLLAASLGISRTPVREALASLAREGLVVIRPQSGTFVMVLDKDSVRALCEMRTVLELGALRLLADHPERLAIAVSKRIAAGALAVEAGDVEEAERMDSEFHKAMVHAAENPLLSEAYRVITHKLDAIRYRLPADLERMSRAVEQHRRIVDLTVTGRIEEASAELVAHMKTVEELALQIAGSEAFEAAPGRRARKSALAG